MSWDRSFVLELLPHLVTLVAAFSGAWFAFLLNDRAKARQTVRDQVAAINRAQFALIRQFNTLKVVQAQAVEPIRQHPGYHIAMRALLPLRDDAPELDLGSLSFLLETEDRELLLELMIENQRFKTAVQAINERSRLHLDEVQPRLEPAGIREGGQYSESDCLKALGEPLYLTLKRATDAAIDHVDQSIVSCESLVARLYDAMKKRYPKQTIIRLDPNRPSNQRHPTAGGAVSGRG